ncbi:MAG: hypothetical protein AAF206_22720 [Bacteroidota bacterium]
MKNFFSFFFVILLTIIITVVLDRGMIRNQVHPNSFLTSMDVDERGGEWRAFDDLEDQIPSGENRMVVRIENGIQLIDPREIIACEKSGKDLTIYLLNETIVAKRKTIESFLLELPEGGNTFCDFRSDILNLNFVSKVTRENVGTIYKPNYHYAIVLENGHKVPLPTRKKDLFLEKLSQFVGLEEVKAFELPNSEPTFDH